MFVREAIFQKSVTNRTWQWDIYHAFRMHVS